MPLGPVLVQDQSLHWYPISEGFSFRSADLLISNTGESFAGWRQTIRSIVVHVSQKMLKYSSHMRLEVKCEGS
jgi:hypothetical protein